MTVYPVQEPADDPQKDIADVKKRKPCCRREQRHNGEQTSDHKEDKDPGLILRISEKPLIPRMAILFAVLFGILIFGVYGYGYQAAAFVYTQF